MSDSGDRSLLEQSVERLFFERCGPDVVAAAEGGYDTGLWDLAERAGFTLAGVPQSAGGSGADTHDTAAIVRIAARHAAPIPLAETAMLAGWALAEAGLTIPSGPLAATWSTADTPIELRRDGDHWRLAGSAPAVAFARTAEVVVVVTEFAGEPAVAAVNTGDIELAHDQNLAGEPRDDLRFADLKLPVEAVAIAATVTESSAVTAETMALRGAFARSLQLAGALERVLELTVSFANEREQFGRPIGRFQAVAQQLAQMAGETAAAVAAVEQAVDAVAARGERAAAEEIAIAKLRTSESAGTVAAIAHQIHGAIGVTREHRLQHFTRRLWSWRDENGNEQAWAHFLGSRVLSRGPDELWQSITS